MSERGSWPGEADPDGEADEPDDGVATAEVEAAADGAPADVAAPEVAADDEDTGDGEPELRIAGHEGGELEIPDDVDVLEGERRSTRGVGIVVARTGVETANALLESALAELDRAGVARDQVLVMVVPTAFELPIGAMALAKTRRYTCIVALGSEAGSAVVAGEAASGLQLAGLETGVPVAFGLVTDAAEHGRGRGAEAVRNALEMADLFQQLRTSAQAAK